MAKIWIDLYEIALHAEPPQLLEAINAAKGAIFDRLRVLQVPKKTNDSREQHALFLALHDLHVLVRCCVQIQISEALAKTTAGSCRTLEASLNQQTLVSSRAVT